MDARVLSLSAFALALTAFTTNGIVQKDGARGQDGVATLRTSTQLVFVDVVVHDKQGNPVHGLKAEDFALQENGTPQRFKGFEEHTAPTPAEVAQAQAMLKQVTLSKTQPGTFSNFRAAAIDGPMNVLLIDRLNTSVADQLQMQKQINEFLDHARPGMRFAVFELTDQLHFRQGFTDDVAEIRASLVGKGLTRSPLLAVPPSMSSPLGDDVDSARGPTSSMPKEAKKFAAWQLDLRRKISLHAMNGMARYLTTVPGRKNVLWFSGSFPIVMMNMLDQAGTGLGSGVKAGAEREFQETTALLSQGQTAMYPIDVKGLTVPSGFTAEGGSGADAEGINDHDEMSFGEHQTMYEVAANTGGKAFVNTNDFTTAMSKALDDGSNYYSIAYTPSDAKWNGSYRRIEVQLQKKGCTISYRRGYFAVTPEGWEQPGKAFVRGMQLALTHGAPLPTQLLFSARVQPVSAAAEEGIAPRNKPAKGVAGPFRRYRVDYAIDPRAIHFLQGADGVRHETLEFIVFVFDDKGKPLNSVSNSIKTAVTSEQYAQFLQSGVPFHQEISVPTKGEISVRIAMRDVEANLVGAVELPVKAVSGLPPLEASAQVK